MSKRKIMRSYDKEFKLNAVNLYLQSDRSYQQVGNELGIPAATLVGWVLAHKKDGPVAFPGKGYLRPTDAEIAELRKELAHAREERDILKKALGIFSSQRK
jgi:transposase-like protein